MSKFQPYDALSSAIRFDDFSVCWAGSFPVPNHFGFGSEDGRLFCTNESGEALTPPQRVSDSGEAINGVAWHAPWVCVTTRSEINLIGRPSPGVEKPIFALLPAGAHGVVAIDHGYFVCPAGLSGVVVVRPDAGPDHPPLILNSGDDSGPYFYHIVNLRGPGGRDVLACATRKDGVAALELKGDQATYNASTISFKGLDVVDVCALNPGSNSLAVAALGRDGTLALFRDVLLDKKPVTINRFESIQGTAYRLLSCRGDIYVLTSKGLFVLGKVVERFLRGELTSSTVTPVLRLPIEPVDFNLAHDRWLLVVTADEVRKFDVELIHQSMPDEITQKNGVQKLPGLPEIHEFRQTILTRDWQWHAIEQRTNELAGTTSQSSG